MTNNPLTQAMLNHCSTSHQAVTCSYCPSRKWVLVPPKHKSIGTVCSLKQTHTPSVFCMNSLLGFWSNECQELLSPTGQHTLVARTWAEASPRRADPVAHALTKEVIFGSPRRTQWEGTPTHRSGSTRPKSSQKSVNTTVCVFKCVWAVTKGFHIDNKTCAGGCACVRVCK